MAFNIFKWLLRRDEEESERTGKAVSVGDFLESGEPEDTGGLEAYLMRMAFWAIVRKIGSAVAAVEWETYRRKKKVKSREYWQWNYSPNPNQTRDEFFMDLIGTLFMNQEALIVETREGYRYVADSFSFTERLSGNVYNNIFINNESVTGIFNASDVLHLTIEGDNIRRIINTIAAAEGRLMKSSIANYLRSQSIRGVLHIDDTAEADPNFEENYAKLVNEKFKKYFTSRGNAVLPLFKGYEFTEKSTNGGSSKSELIGTRDIRHQIDDIMELTAQAFGVPTSIVTGKNVTDADFKTFMTFTVQPIVKMIVTEMNRKLYGRELISAGTYAAANLAGVRYTDVFDVANPIDKLIGSGAFCINDIRMRLGLDVIDEPWAWQHWMTKNYSSVEDLLVGVDSEEPAAQPEEKEGSDEQTNEKGSSTGSGG